MKPALSAEDLSKPRTVCDLVAAAAHAHGARPAIGFLGREYSYGELGALVDRAAKGFADLGVDNGMRVGLCLPNSPALVIAYFAVLKAGGTVVSFNPLGAPEELEHQLVDADVGLMVTTDLVGIYPKLAGLLGKRALRHLVVHRMRDMLPPVKGLMFSLVKRRDVVSVPRDARHTLFTDLIDNRGLGRPPRIDPLEDLATLQYTGGTTGLPKGAMLTHANLMANTEQIFSLLPDPRIGRESVLGVLPLFHVFGMTVAMNLAVRLAAKMILVPRFDAGELVRTIERQRPTLLPGVPTIYSALNRAVEERKEADLSSIRYCISGGAPLPGEVRARFERLTGCRLAEGYGLSECAPVACCNPLDGTARDGSIGRPLPLTEVEIRPLDDPARLCGTNEIGELCVRGPQLMEGYWRREAETEAAFVDGAFRTGDIGYRDADGFVFLLDRIKDLIVCSGYNVYPRVIEEALHLHPAVSEAVAIGVADSYRGAAPKAFVVLRAGIGATPDTLHSFLRDHLSPIEVPVAIEIRENLPRTIMGKLSRKALIEEEARATSRAAGGGNAA
jgi:long-chain acyl-CoA synthetase